MSLQASVSSIIPKKQPYGPGIGNAARELRSKGLTESAGAFESLLQRLNTLDAAARGDSQGVREILVTDSTGKVIGAIGEFIFQGVPVTNYFSEIHVGDPLGTGNPSQALFNANSDGSVTIGQHGWLDVLDPYGGDAAWLGTQYDTLAVTGAIASPTTPLIRLTVTGHTLATGDVVRVLAVGGVPNATGVRTVTKINANTIDLQSTVFVGTYTSGGTVDRLMHVTGAVGAAGLIRLTVATHGYESGDKVNVQGVGGVSAATGQWIITVISANTFDLVGSVFAGTYTSGGTCLRYFAGGLFQTIAVGPSFADYRLRAFADGSLKIRDAEIDIQGLNGTVEIANGTITLVSNSQPLQSFTLAYNAIVLTNDSGSGVSFYQLDGQDALLQILNNGATKSIQLIGNTGQVSINGATAAPDNQLAIRANSLGFIGLYCNGADSSALDYDVEVVGGNAVSRDTSVVAVRKGSDKLTWLGSTGNVVGSAPTLNTLGVLDLATGAWGFGGTVSPSEAVDANGYVNASIGFKVAGVAGLSNTRNFGTSLSVNTSAVGVFGTPGALQVNGTVVTGVTLNTTANTTTGGILTA